MLRDTDIVTSDARFVTRMLEMITRELQETGDRDWVFDCLAEASIRISHIENMSRRVASGLARLGLGPGSVLHTAYNSQVSSHPMVASYHSVFKLDLVWKCW